MATSIQQLFELTFIDNTKLWASINVVNGIGKNDTICFGTLGHGLAIEVKKLFEQDKNRVCFVAAEFAKNQSLVKEYRDFVEEESNRVLDQLLKAF